MTAKTVASYRDKHRVKFDQSSQWKYIMVSYIIIRVVIQRSSCLHLLLRLLSIFWFLRNWPLSELINNINKLQMLFIVILWAYLAYNCSSKDLPTEKAPKNTWQWIWLIESIPQHHQFYMGMSPAPTGRYYWSIQVTPRT